MVALSQSLFDLSGKVAIALRLAQHGASVVVASRRIETCETVARAINAETGRDCARAAACNIGRKDDLAALERVPRAQARRLLKTQY